MCVDRCDLTDRKRRSEKGGSRLGVVGDMDGGSSASQASRVADRANCDEKWERDEERWKRDGREREREDEVSEL